MWSLSLVQMNSVLPSLDSTMPRGRSPTAIVSVTFSVCPSTTVIVLSFSLDTRMRSARAPVAAVRGGDGESEGEGAYQG